MRHSIRLLMMGLWLSTTIIGTPSRAQSAAQRTKAPASLPDKLTGTVSVPPTGEPVQTGVLEAGVSYIVLGQGTVELGSCDGSHCPGGRAGTNRQGDAAYATGEGWRTYGAAQISSPGGLYLDGHDVDWGPFRPDHSYRTTVVGTGAPLVLQYYDADGRLDDNRGALSISLFEVGGEPLERGSWKDLQHVLAADAPSWMDPRDFSAAASAVMAAASLGRLPAWPSWVSDEPQAPTAQEIARGIAPGWQTDWGPYLGSAFQFPGEDAWNQVSLDRAGTPISGVAGSLGPDQQAAERLAEVLTQLGMRVEIQLAPNGEALDPGISGPALEQASRRRWPVIVAFLEEGKLGFALVSSFIRYDERLELSLLDPTEHDDHRNAPRQYRIVTPGTTRMLPEDQVPLLDGLIGLWAVSGPEGPLVRFTDFILDDSTPWFSLRNEGQLNGQAFDYGFGAPGRAAGRQAWGLTWLEPSAIASEGTPAAEASWRVVAPESGTYGVWIHLPPELDETRLASSQTYYLTATDDEPLSESYRLGTVKPTATADAGWHFVGRAPLREGVEAFVRMPLEGSPGRRFIMDAVWLVKD